MSTSEVIDTVASTEMANPAKVAKRRFPIQRPLFAVAIIIVMLGLIAAYMGWSGIDLTVNDVTMHGTSDVFVALLITILAIAAVAAAMVGTAMILVVVLVLVAIIVAGSILIALTPLLLPGLIVAALFMLIFRRSN